MDGEQVVAALAQTGAQISVEITKVSIEMLIRAFNAARKALHKAGSQAVNPLKHGQISVRALQKSAGGDVRHEAVSPELMNQLRKELKAYGVDFSITNGADGKSYVHFSAKDMPAIEYALEQTHATVVGTVPERQRGHSPEERTAKQTTVEQPTAEEPAVEEPKAAVEEPAVGKGAETPEVKTRADVKESIEARAKDIKAEAPTAALSRSVPVKGVR